MLHIYVVRQTGVSPAAFQAKKNAYKSVFFVGSITGMGKFIARRIFSSHHEEYRYIPDPAAASGKVPKK
jgi:hypothetical protein